jgi:MIP family channel proteins
MSKVLDVTEVQSTETVKSLVAELVGTLILVLVGTGIITATAAVDAAIAQGPVLDSARMVAIALGMGLTYTVVVALTSGISGGHVNPAVTLAAVVSGRMGLPKGVAYMGAQLVGAILGAFILKALLAEAAEGTLGAVPLSGDVTDLVLAKGAGFAIEILLSFVLVLAMLAAVLGPGRAAPPLAPLVVGLVVTVGTLLAYPLTGAAMNPARALASSWAADLWTNHWWYWLGPAVGAVAAVVVYEGILVGRLLPTQAKAVARAAAPTVSGGSPDRE